MYLCVYSSTHIYEHLNMLLLCMLITYVIYVIDYMCNTSSACIYVFVYLIFLILIVFYATATPTMYTHIFTNVWFILQVTCATDTQNVRNVFDTCKDIIIKQNLKDSGFME